MREIKPLLRRYRIWNQHLEKICNEIGENELAYRPMPESNSAAWVLVHLIKHYREFVELSAPDEAKELLADFAYPSEEELAKLPFSQIFFLLESTREVFIKEVKRLNEEEQLENVVPAGEGKTWEDLVHTVINHEVYHCGQLAYIARILQQKSRSSK